MSLATISEEVIKERKKLLTKMCQDNDFKKWCLDQGRELFFAWNYDKVYSLPQKFENDFFEGVKSLYNQPIEEFAFYNPLRVYFLSDQETQFEVFFKDDTYQLFLYTYNNETNEWEQVGKYVFSVKKFKPPENIKFINDQVVWDY